MKPNRIQRLRRVWLSMLDRCERPSNRAYKNYGGRGIKVCHEWHEFNSFYDWATTNGFKNYSKQGKCTLDRIDNNGNYEPSNCRWVSMQKQMNNTRRNRFITYRGKELTLAQLSRELKMDYRTLWYRLNELHWSVEKAAETPYQKVKREKYIPIKESENLVDTNYLKYLIAQKGLSVGDVALMLGISTQGLYKKLRGDADWYLRDMKCLKELLEMSNDDFNKVFGF